MPESKKISQLPAFATVVANDILPIVDASLTQTGKCTAAQIAAIGGGPPGTNTINDTMVQTGGITPAKIGFSAADKIVYASADTNVFSGVTRYRGAEAALSTWARGLLERTTAEAARGYLDALQSTANPVFTGQVRFSPGTAATPSIVRNETLPVASGIYFPQPEAVAFSISGVERWRIQGDGYVWTPLNEEPTIQRPTTPARAFVVLNGTYGSAQSFSVTANQRSVASRYGLVGTIADTSASRGQITTIETARNITATFPDSPTFSDAYGKGTFPRRNLGTENRANYTSPGDNTHWNWNGSAWVQIAANNQPWLGTINYLSTSTGNGILSYGNVAAVIRQATAGVYRIYFQFSMPTIDTANAATLEQYGAVATMNQAGFCFVSAFTTTYIEVTCRNTSNAAVDPSCLTVAVFR
jgi:hypothetical protein